MDAGGYPEREKDGRTCSRVPHDRHCARHARRGRAPSSLATTLTALAFAGSIGAGAAEVRVVDDEGKPLTDAMVACMGKESGAALTGPEGLATVPDACREVYCERGDRVNEIAKIVDGHAECRLRSGLLLRVFVEDELCARSPKGDPRSLKNRSMAPCYAGARDVQLPRQGNRSGPRSNTEKIAGGVPRRGDGGLMDLGSDGRPRWESKPLLPGAYLVTVGLANSNWWCTTELDALPAVTVEEKGILRAPLEIRGRVLDRDGRPATDVPLFVQPKTPAAGRQGSWYCERDPFDDPPVTAADGSFTILVDPLVTVVVDAGWKDYPIGTASALVKGKPEGELVLRLSGAP